MRSTFSRWLATNRVPASALLRAVAILMLLAVPVAVARAASELEKARTNPDYHVQGEYQGSLSLAGQPEAPAGAQVVAEGKGEFAAVLFQGGLPGDGWKSTAGRIRGSGKTTGGGTELHFERASAVLADGKLTFADPAGKPIGTLVRVERQSPTLGQSPPKDALVLFDGSSVDAWIGGRLGDDHTLAAGTVSKQEFRDFFLHLEFCLPFSPRARGQQRGNSGVYLQNRYELQVLDSFGLDGAINECGALYNQRAPLVNMCFPPLTWQTYDVTFTAARFDGAKDKLASARVTVKHNGTLIHDDVEITGPTGGALGSEYPGLGPLQLQWHFSTVTYRNIWIVEKKNSSDR
ncbi:MAG TPA: DUF1080 domain-containing protein [Pirellulales bacterium]|nr:DUF1080 domain-containing protein [Pirellulales bacterium]